MAIASTTKHILVAKRRVGRSYLKSGLKFNLKKSLLLGWYGKSGLEQKPWYKTLAWISFKMH